MTCGAIADRLLISYVKETTFGEAPSPATLQELRIKGEGLQKDQSVVDSTEIRADRQTADTILTDVSTSGDISFELSYGSFDAWLSSSLMDDDGWSTPVTDIAADTGIAADNATNQYQGAIGAFTNYTVGSWVEVRGSAYAENNGYAKITAKAGDSSTITVSHKTLVTEAAGASVSITQGAEIINGTLVESYQIEKKWTDITNTFHQFAGQVINSMKLTTSVEQIIEGSFSFMGQTMAQTAATIGTTANTPVNTNEPMAAVDDVIGIFEDGSTICVTSFSLEINNGLRGQKCIGQAGPNCFAPGKLKVTGSLSAYFQSQALFDKYLNFASTSLAQVIEDSVGNAYIIDLPFVRYTAGPVVAGGENNDIMVDLTYSATKDPIEGITIRMVRFAA